MPSQSLKPRPGPLGGTVVLELASHVAGPMCGKLLAEYGATVIKVEAPGCGDSSRSWGPFPGDRPESESSGLFLYVNSGKKSVTIDLSTVEGRATFLALAAKAHVVVETHAPGTLDSLGIGWEELNAANPTLMLVSVTSFGQTGPYRNYRASELSLYAIGGSMWPTGLPNREPQALGPYVIQSQAGFVAAGVTAAARYQQLRGGCGQHVDVAIMETITGSIDRGGTALLCVAYSDSLSYFRATTQRMFLMPTGVFPCADGYVTFLTYVPSWWPRFCTMIDRPDLIDHPQYSTSEGVYNVAEYQEEIDGILMGWLLSHTRQEIEELGQAAGMAVTRVNSVGDLIGDEHLRSRGFWRTVEHPVVGRIPMPGPHAVFQDGGWSTSPAPLLGADTNDVLSSMLGLDAAELSRMRIDGVI